MLDCWPVAVVFPLCRCLQSIVAISLAVVVVVVVFRTAGAVGAIGAFQPNSNAIVHFISIFQVSNLRFCVCVCRCWSCSWCLFAASQLRVQQCTPNKDNNNVYRFDSMPKTNLDFFFLFRPIQAPCNVIILRFFHSLSPFLSDSIVCSCFA